MRVFFCVLYMIVIVNGEIKKKFVKNIASKSLFCSGCAMIAKSLNETLFNKDIEFETNVGFRLDSSGKKIRKNSQWLKLHVTLEDINCEWKKGIFKK